jgi:DUF177 domain-containing protein
MAAEYHSIDLAQLGLSSGEGRRLVVDVDVGGFQLAGQRYEPAGRVPVRLDISRAVGGHAFRLAFETEVEGPCMRCLADARVPVVVEAREVHHGGGDDEELTSPYVEGDVLDLGSWAHDALALALPAQLLCRPDCAGLCAICGASLNDADPADHEHLNERGGPFAKLGELPPE